MLPTDTGETGTRPAQTILGLGHAMSYLTSFEGGMAAVQEHNLAMAALAWRLLSAKQIPGMERSSLLKSGLLLCARRFA